MQIPAGIGRLIAEAYIRDFLLTGIFSRSGEVTYDIVIKRHLMPINKEEEYVFLQQMRR